MTENTNTPLPLCTCVACEERRAETPAGSFFKADAGKTRLGLLPAVAIEAVGWVLTYGAKKYAPDNWRKVDELSRYYDAALRHLMRRMRGEYADPESGLPHVAHAACCLLFILELEEVRGPSSWCFVRKDA